MEMNGSRPGISIVVPTHNRVESLEQCLERLAAQESKEPVEIIIVDDGSEAAEQIAQLASRTPEARLLRQAKQGPAGARNARVPAARRAAGGVTDEDCRPQPNWAKAL